MTRKAYLEMKEEHTETDKLIKELEKYLQELSHDVLEMTANSTTEEKAIIQQKLTTLVNKIK
jgi:molybdopterin biosynthesis enzyme MoaB